jgi:hypothetical protein
MPDFNIRSDSINVEQIMEQIRERIREKRGVDYTEQQIRDLAAVKLEKFLDPSGVRSNLLEEFRRMRPATEVPQLPNYAFDENAMFYSHRAPVRWIRRLLRPFLKLLFNPTPLIQALSIQSRLTAFQIEAESTRRARDQLSFEVLHNLVVETTRLGIDVKNLKMRVESLASRLDFTERRARALEGAVVYKPSIEGAAQQAPQRISEEAPPQRQPYPPGGGPGSLPGAVQAPEGPGQRSRRRRRRRGRRGGAPPAATVMGGGPASETRAADTPAGLASEAPQLSPSPGVNERPADADTRSTGSGAPGSDGGTDPSSQ